MLALAHSIAMLFLARIVDGLSGGNISTARAYVADVTEPKDRARAYGLIGAAFGLGFIMGPALSGVLAKVSYTAPIWAAAALTLVATAMAWFWLPETVHRATAGAGNPLSYLPGLLQRPAIRRVLTVDFIYWFAFSIFQTTFALFVARRFDFNASRTGYFLAGFGVLGALIQGGFIRPIVKQTGDKPTFMAGVLFSIAGLVAAAMSHSVMLFAISLVPLAFGMGFGHPPIGLVARGRGRAGRVRAAGGRKPRADVRSCVGECVAAALRRGDAVYLRRGVSGAGGGVRRRTPRHRRLGLRRGPTRSPSGSRLSSSSSVSCLWTSRRARPGPRDFLAPAPPARQRNGRRP